MICVRAGKFWLAHCVFFNSWIFIDANNLHFFPCKKEKAYLVISVCVLVSEPKPHCMFDFAICQQQLLNYWGVKYLTSWNIIFTCFPHHLLCAVQRLMWGNLAYRCKWAFEHGLCVCSDAQSVFVYMWMRTGVQMWEYANQFARPPAAFGELHHIAGVGSGSSNTFHGCNRNWSWLVNVYRTAVCALVLAERCSELNESWESPFSLRRSCLFVSEVMRWLCEWCCLLLLQLTCLLLWLTESLQSHKKNFHHIKLWTPLCNMSLLHGLVRRVETILCGWKWGFCFTGKIVWYEHGELTYQICGADDVENWGIIFLIHASFITHRANLHFSHNSLFKPPLCSSLMLWLWLNGSKNVWLINAKLLIRR